MSNARITPVSSAFDLFSKSYEAVMRNLNNFLVLLALPLLGALISTGRNSAHSGSTWKHGDFFNGTTPAYSIIGVMGFGLIVFLLIAILALIIQAMLTGLELEAAKDHKPSLGHLWTIGKKYWLRLLGLILVIGMYIVGTSLIGIIILVVFRNLFGVVIGGGLIVAAILFVLSHYFLAPYAMIDKDLPILTAMEYSANISKNHAGAIFSVLGVMVLLGFTGIVPVIGPILSFVLGALYSVAPALRYLELKKLA